ncbi:MAG: threonine/serine exporter ThrE family protein, partial [Candidatus Weimeria sp.]
MLLSCGTGAWRVRNSMNDMARKLDVICSVNVGFMTIDYSCISDDKCISQSLCLTSSGVNTSRLNELEAFVRRFLDADYRLSADDVHNELDRIEKEHTLHSPAVLGLSAAVACGAFTFLLGGGPVEMLCAFIGAGVGNFVRSNLISHRFTLFSNIIISVVCACLAYYFSFLAFMNIGGLSRQHEAGYICSMLFIIPGFPFITSGIDLAKQDMRSGIERLAYSIMIVTVASITAWAMAFVLHLKPDDFLALKIPIGVRIFFWLVLSFCGVFGFSIMFNSSAKMAASAASIGCIGNTLRLTLSNVFGCPMPIAAFIGALVCGLLASMLKNRLGYPRISVTVPSVVIMVPGLFFYRAVYNLGAMNLIKAASNFASSFLILLAISMGLITARMISDESFRYCT